MTKRADLCGLGCIYYCNALRVRGHIAFSIEINPSYHVHLLLINAKMMMMMMIFARRLTHNYEHIKTENELTNERRMSTRLDRCNGNRCYQQQHRCENGDMRRCYAPTTATQNMLSLLNVHLERT